MGNDAQNICLECGLCCNGVIFADGQLQPGDDVEHLGKLGLRLKVPRANIASKHPQIRKFAQPCGAFDGCQCRIYRERPAYCRQFECALLKRVAAGEIEAQQGLRVIRKAKKQAARVARLLRDLGDDDEQAPLQMRFRRVSRRIDSSGPAADLFGELTLAVHALNCTLSQQFYPGPG